MKHYLSIFYLLIGFALGGSPFFLSAQCNGSASVLPDERSAVFNFSGVDNGYVDVTYYPTSAGPGSSSTVGGNGEIPLGLTSLLPCTEYTYTTVYSCKDGSSTGGGTFETTCPNCPPPSGITVEVGEDSVTFVWDERGGFRDYEVVVSEVGGSTGGSRTLTAARTTFYNLLPCTDYTYSIKADCGFNGASIASVGEFTTKGNCSGGGGSNCRAIQVPEINIVERTSSLGNSVTISWPDVGASSVTFSYQQVGGNISGSLTPTLNFISFNNLPACNKFTFTLEVTCPGGGTYQTAPIEYRTPGCGSCGVITTNEITVEPGYDDAVVSWPAATGDIEGYIVSLVKVNVGQIENEAFVPATTTSLRFTGLVPCQTDYYVNLIVVCKDGTEPFSGAINLQTTCGACSSLDETSIAVTPSETSADISWDAPSGDVDYYVINYLTPGTGFLPDTVRFGTSTTLQGLPCGSKVEFYIRTVCKNGTSSIAPLSTFFTRPCSNTCDAPDVADIGVLTGETEASVFFPPTGGSNKLILKKGGVKVAQVNLGTGSNYTFTNLEPCCTTYTVKVRTTCPNGTFNSGSKPFSTICNGSSGKTAPAALVDGVTVFPNPAKDRLQVEIMLQANAKVSGKLFDLQGRVIRELWQEEALFAGRSVLSREVGDLTRGLYVLRLSIGEKQVYRRINLR